jgi:hypothetical protein
MMRSQQEGIRESGVIAGFHSCHKEFLSEERLTEMKEEIEDLVTNLGGAYMNNIEDVLKKTKLRTDEDPRAPSPTHWECPYDKQEKTIGIICLDNGRTRRVVNSIEKVIDVCLSDDDVESIIGKRAISEYRKGFEILRRKQDLSDDEIREFQLYMDKFFSDWIKVNKGDAGVTNYILLLGAGHISDYLFYHRNLYIHSQQGWESFNSMLKTFYFRRTARGGTRWGDKSRLIPIAKWLQRRMMWMLGIFRGNGAVREREECIG